MPDENNTEIDQCLDIFSFKILNNLNELKARYRVLSKLHHPDIHPQHTELSNFNMQELNRAYDILSRKLKDGITVLKHSLYREQKDISVLLNEGDIILRDAVILGWLSKYPQHKTAKETTDKLLNIVEELKKSGRNAPFHFGIPFFADLFNQFLNVLEWSRPIPMPKTWNSTRFFKRFKYASGFLESGIRDFYYYNEKGSLEVMSKIPLSYLEDALLVFSRLTGHITESLYLKRIATRMQLANLFKKRILNRNLRSVSQN